MATVLYGIANCDTVRKARRWLDEHQVDYRFHDYKKAGIERERLQSWCDRVEWTQLLNRRGTTWRKLSDAARDGVDQTRALDLMLEHTSLIKRPVVETGEDLLVGFDAAEWSGRFT